MEKVKKENKMLTIIQEDPKLDALAKMEYLTLARHYIEDFKENIKKTSIELDEVTDYGIDTWKEFLNYAPIRKYIDSFVHEQINKNVDQSLASGQGARDAIGIKKAMDTMNNATNNEFFVIFRLPDKDDDSYELSGQL